MDNRARRLVVTTAFALVSLPVALQAQAPEPGVGYSVADWPFVGGDQGSSRYSTLADISLDTIDRLGGAWVTRLDGGGSSRSTPVVKDGVIYLTAGPSVHAISGATGETLWRWQSDDPEARMVPTWQGVGLSEELVFVGLASAQVAALRQDTGALVWATAAGSVPSHDGEAVTTAPMHARGKVFVGVANGDSGGQGRVVALDAATGEIEWTFFVVPRPGEFGHETWPQDSKIWEVGGGGVWLNGNVDPELGLVYFSTGNPVPMFGGEVREGDNLFTAAVLALDMETGERRWHFQVVRHDIWDADIATPTLQYDVEMGGQTRKALAAIRADGLLFLFDRETGEPLIPIEQRPVPQDARLLTADTQPFPVGSESIIPDCSYWRDRVAPPFELSCSVFTPPSVGQESVVALGSPIPMVRVTPMAFSPQTGYIYAQGRGHVGRAKRFADPWISDNRPDGYLRLGLPESTGVLAAVDPKTNRVAWKQELPGGRLGTSGPLATAGGLVFWGAADGQLDAYDAQTGERVWAFQATPAGTRLRPGPTATYAVDGTQYVAIPMGNELWAFALDGTVPPRDEPLAEPLADLVRWTGPPPRETNDMETSTLRENPSWSLGGSRGALDEHAFNPQRAQVSVGERLRIINNGELSHTVVAHDGSWTTGVIEPGLFGSLTFDAPGTFLFHCEEHPWALGEVTVVP
ncbi:MAG: PQQ-binding-like beta-propeller repeat protein [Acidobacteria bacterium]|nr:PQQ-binding-like beta-propeller repeat protein [Acidobacteriota bacterium]